MPFYQFTVTAGSISTKRKAQIAQAITSTHCELTGAPTDYVNVSFVEVPVEDGIYVGGEPVSTARMVGLVRRRSEALTKKLLLSLADAWSGATGRPNTEVAMFIIDIPGYQVFEKGGLLPEADQDPSAKV